MIWVAIVLTGAGSYLFRLVPLVVLPRLTLRPGLERAVRHAGVAAIAALLVSSLQTDAASQQHRPDPRRGGRRTGAGRTWRRNAARRVAERPHLRDGARHLERGVLRIRWSFRRWGRLVAWTGRRGQDGPPRVEIALLGRFEVMIDGQPVASRNWARRHAATLVKVLALTPGRRLHREQVVDMVWPGESLDVAAPKLHKAAHYARRATGQADAVVLRDDTVQLFPDAEVTVDAVEFDELSRRAIAAGDVELARRALDLYRGELCPQDRYEEWAEVRREPLRLRHLDLLRLNGRWEELVDARTRRRAGPRGADAPL